MKERPIIFSGEMVRAILDGRKAMTRRVIKYYQFDFRQAPATSTECPYGQPGDRLWVRETWSGPLYPQGDRIFYKANGVEDDSGERDGWWFDIPGKKGEEEFIPNFKANWKSPLFMPRWASRILLEITAVRVERIKDIAGKDIEAEGIPVDFTISGAFSALHKFHELWDSLNAKRGYGWDANPWVWVISFRRIQP